MFNDAMLDKSLMEIRVCRGALAINHLFFADDSLIFYKATPETFTHLLKILTDYAQTLGKCINNEKTTMVRRKLGPIYQLFGGVVRSSNTKNI